MTTAKDTSLPEPPNREIEARIPALEGIRDRLAGVRVERGRWSAFRQTNVDEVGRLWQDGSIVRAFHDPKLVREGIPLVMLRQDLFELMQNVLTQLLTGQLAVASEFKQVTTLVGVIQRIAEDPTSVKELAGVAVEQAQRLASVFVVPPHVSAPEHPSLTDEEEEWLRNNLDKEAGDDDDGGSAESAERS